MILLFSDEKLHFKYNILAINQLSTNYVYYFSFSELQLCNHQVTLVLPSRYTSATHELLNCNRLTLLEESIKRIA